MIKYESFVVPQHYWDNLTNMRRTSYIKKYYTENGIYPTQEQISAVVLSAEEIENFNRRYYAGYLAKQVENNNVIIPPVISPTDPPKEDIIEIKVGDNLPSFQVTMNNGDVISNETLQGNISVIVFFHTSCPDCQEILPIIQQLYDEYQSKEVQFVLISRECDAEEIQTYWDSKGLSLPYSAQEDRTIFNLFASTRIPRIYIADKDSMVRYIFTDDPQNPTYDELKESLVSLLTIEVNANNISGTWVDENDENHIITLVRKDKTYTLQMNGETFTGCYNLQTNENDDVIIRGNYDYNSSDWEHRYIIQDLTETSMRWVATDDSAIAYNFVKQIVNEETPVFVKATFYYQQEDYPSSKLYHDGSNISEIYIDGNLLETMSPEYDFYVKSNEEGGRMPHIVEYKLINKERINSEMFYNCDMEEVEIPDSVQIIDSNAFYECPNLFSVKLSSKVYQINNYAFAHCTRLRTIELPSTIKLLGAGVFADCENLQCVIVNNKDIPYWRTDTFLNVGKNGVLVHPENSEYLDWLNRTEEGCLGYYGWVSQNTLETIDNTVSWDDIVDVRGWRIKFLYYNMDSPFAFPSNDEFRFYFDVHGTVKVWDNENNIGFCTGGPTPCDFWDEEYLVFNKETQTVTKYKYSLITSTDFCSNKKWTNHYIITHFESPKTTNTKWCMKWIGKYAIREYKVTEGNDTLTGVYYDRMHDFIDFDHDI